MLALLFDDVCLVPRCSLSGPRVLCLLGRITGYEPMSESLLGCGGAGQQDGTPLSLSNTKQGSQYPAASERCCEEEEARCMAQFAELGAKWVSCNGLCFGCCSENDTAVSSTDSAARSTVSEYLLCHSEAM